MDTRPATSVRRTLGLLVAVAALGVALLASAPAAGAAPTAEASVTVPAQPAPGTCVTATNAEHAAAGRVTVFLIFAYTDHFVGFTWSTTTMRLNDRGTWDHIFTPC
jgi:hypothetical protein